MRREAAAVAAAMVAVVAVSAGVTFAVLQATSNDGEVCFTRELAVRLAGPRAAWVEPYPDTSQWLRARHFDENKSMDSEKWPDEWRDENGVISNIIIDGKMDRVYLGSYVANGEPWRVNLRECRSEGGSGVSYWLEDR